MTITGEITSFDDFEYQFTQGNHTVGFTISNEEYSGFLNFLYMREGDVVDSSIDDCRTGTGLGMELLEIFNKGVSEDKLDNVTYCKSVLPTNLLTAQLNTLEAKGYKDCADLAALHNAIANECAVRNYDEYLFKTYVWSGMSGLTYALGGTALAATFITGAVTWVWACLLPVIYGSCAIRASWIVR